jgi:putative Mg2+ transporter-C (MgtC) family protein
MTLTLTPGDVALRIVLTIIAGLAFGVERSLEGHSAGAKTTILVALAACLSMLQANWLMTSVGKAPGSFVTLDLMRLPLGILTGVGFIGGGAILKRGDSVLGLTTAATLWFVTVVGLCFGGGQLALGVIGAALGLAVLRIVKEFERRLSAERQAELKIIWREDDFSLDAALATVRSAELHLREFEFVTTARKGSTSCAVSYGAGDSPRTTASQRR